MNRCPNCKAVVSLARFIRLESDYVFCGCCGTSIHVPSVFLVGSVFPVPVSPAFSPVRVSSTLQANGKLKKSKAVQQPPVNQLDLFGGAV